MLRATLAVVLLMMPTAGYAFGLLLGSGSEQVDITDVRVLFHVGADSTTVHVQLGYEGASEQLAWLVPVPASSRLENTTSEILYRLEEERPVFTAHRDPSIAQAHNGDDVSSLARVSSVQDRYYSDCGEAIFQTFMPLVSIYPCLRGTCQTVYVEWSTEAARESVAWIEPGSSAAVRDWVLGHGYSDTRLDLPTVQAYMDNGARFLAVELVRPAGLPVGDTGDVQPLAFAYPGEDMAIPLQLAVAAGAIRGGLTTWIGAGHRGVPLNYLHVHLNPMRLDWTGPYTILGFGRIGGYDTVLADAVEEVGGSAFVTELAEADGYQNYWLESKWRNLDIDPLGPSEGLIGFLNDLWYNAVIPQGMGIESAEARPIDAQFLQLLREYVPLPAPPAEILGDSLAGFHEAGMHRVMAESRFYSFPDQYQEFYSDVQFDYGGFLLAWRETIQVPTLRHLGALDRSAFFTRLSTVIDADAVQDDPTFGLNSDLPEVGRTREARIALDCLGDAPFAWEDLIVVTQPTGGTANRYMINDFEASPAASLPAAMHVEQLSRSGPGVPVRITAVAEEGELPEDTGPAQIASQPNPFNAETVVTYCVPQGQVRVILRIFNALGQAIRTLVDREVVAPGTYSATWDGRDERGQRVSSGVYVLLLEGDGILATHKIGLVR